LTHPNIEKPNPPKALGFLRYSAAIFYDAMLVIALLFVATALLLPFTKGEAINAPVLYPLYLFTVSFIFYGWFWTHGGQTLGLRAWKLKITSTYYAGDITWKQAFVRFITACISWLCLGLGLFWLIWQKDHKTWHDISSHSQIIRLPDTPKTKT